MTGRGWVGVVAGVAIGLGAVLALDASTDAASAKRPVIVSAQQLKINQRISQAAVGRVNQARADIVTLGAAVPLYAVSNGAVGSNLVRGRGAVVSQRVDVGSYRVRFVRNIAGCSWSGTPAGDAPPVPNATSVRLALDTADIARAQLVVRTTAASGQFVDSAFHVQVFC